MVRAEPVEQLSQESNLHVTYASDAVNGFVAIGDVLQALRGLHGHVPETATVGLFAGFRLS